MNSNSIRTVSNRLYRLGSNAPSPQAIPSFSFEIQSSSSLNFLSRNFSNANTKPIQTFQVNSSTLTPARKNPSISSLEKNLAITPTSPTSSISSLLSSRNLFLQQPIVNSNLNSSRFFRFQSTTSSTRKDTTSISTSSPQSKSKSQSKSDQQATESETESDEPPPKASLRERMRFLSRRYGWWALAVYLLASFIDFSLIFAAIHFLGAEHIKEWEDWVREKIGLEKLSKKKDELKDSSVEIEIPNLLGEGSKIELLNNSKAAKEAIELRNGSLLNSYNNTSNFDSNSKNQSIDSLEPTTKKKSNNSNASTLWTEAVLAYTIHKTLLLPFRVMFTAAVLPSFVKLMVKWGLSKPNYVVKNAAKKAHENAARRKMAG